MNDLAIGDIHVEALKAALMASGLSANRASIKAGLGRDYVRDLLRGKVREPSFYKLNRLADVLEVPAIHFASPRPFHA